jgi:hypothetical protein
MERMPFMRPLPAKTWRAPDWATSPAREERFRKLLSCCVEGAPPLPPAVLSSSESKAGLLERSDFSASAAVGSACKVFFLLIMTLDSHCHYYHTIVYINLGASISSISGVFGLIDFVSSNKEECVDIIENQNLCLIFSNFT